MAGDVQARENVRAIRPGLDLPTKYLEQVLEPIYEPANPDAQSRMRRHGYVRGIKERLSA